jgi:hypothetical protein
VTVTGHTDPVTLITEHVDEGGEEAGARRDVGGPVIDLARCGGEDIAREAGARLAVGTRITEAGARCNSVDAHNAFL